MEAEYPSGMAVHFHQSAWCHIQEDSVLHSTAVITSGLIIRLASVGVQLRGSLDKCCRYPQNSVSSIQCNFDL
jgi:hypothetical protein